MPAGPQRSELGKSIGRNIQPINITDFALVGRDVANRMLRQKTPESIEVLVEALTNIRVSGVARFLFPPIEDKPVGLDLYQLTTVRTYEPAP